MSDIYDRVDRAAHRFVDYLTSTRTECEALPAPTSFNARRRTEYVVPNRRPAMTKPPNVSETLVQRRPSSEYWYIVMLWPPFVTGWARDIRSRPLEGDVTRIDAIPGLTGLTVKEREMALAAE